MRNHCACLIGKCTCKSVVTLVDADDWSAVFVDGVLVTQSHSFRADIILQHLADQGIIRVEQLHAHDDNLINAGGEFADTLEQNRNEGIIQ